MAKFNWNEAWSMFKVANGYDVAYLLYSGESEMKML